MRRISGQNASLVLLFALTACRFDLPSSQLLADGSVVDTAQVERMMLVLIDTTGSMSSARIDTVNRFEAVRKQAKDRIRNEASTAIGLAGVAIYIFHDTSLEAKTMGFIDPLAAFNTIDTLVITNGTSPLAGSMCDAVDILVAFGKAAAIGMLDVYTDGGENSTPTAHPCSGPPSSGDFSPFDIGSWQNKVWTRGVNSNVPISTTLFAASMPLNVNPKAATGAELARSTTSALVSDANFFSSLAESTGGQFRLILDDTPLPMFVD